MLRCTKIKYLFLVSLLCLSSCVVTTQHFPYIEVSDGNRAKLTIEPIGYNETSHYEWDYQLTLYNETTYETNDYAGNGQITISVNDPGYSTYIKSDEYLYLTIFSNYVYAGPIYIRMYSVRFGFQPEKDKHYVVQLKNIDSINELYDVALYERMATGELMGKEFVPWTMSIFDYKSMDVYPKKEELLRNLEQARENLN